MPSPTALLASATAALSAEDREAMRVELRAEYQALRAEEQTPSSLARLGELVTSIEALDALDAPLGEDQIDDLAALDARVGIGSEPVEPVAAAAKAKPIALSRLNRAVPARTKPRGARSGVTTWQTPAGRDLAGTAELAEEIHNRIRASMGTKGDHRAVAASLKGDENWYDGRRLSVGDDGGANTDAIAAAADVVEAITAAGGVCGPPEPRYEQQVIATAVRPVRDSLLGFATNRGAVTYVPPIDITDIGVSGGSPVQTVDVISNSEDVGGALKPHQTHDCAAPVTCTVDAVTNVSQVGNLLQRTNPERLESIIANAAAAHARVAEIQLLTTIGSGSTAVSAGTTAVELGAFREAFRKMIHAAANQRSAYRMAPMSPIRVLVPAWFGEAMISDLIGASHSEGITAPATSLDDIAGWLSSAHGIRVTWTLDGVGGQTIPPQPVGQLVAYPGTAPGQVVYYMFPEGGWLFLDGGTLDLGVVRDSTLNATNSLQVFSETFEHACPVGPWSLVVTQGFCTSGASGGQVDPEDLCATGS